MRVACGRLIRRGRCRPSEQLPRTAIYDGPEEPQCRRTPRSFGHAFAPRVPRNIALGEQRDSRERLCNSCCIQQIPKKRVQQIIVIGSRPARRSRWKEWQPDRPSARRKRSQFNRRQASRFYGDDNRGGTTYSVEHNLDRKVPIGRTCQFSHKVGAPQHGHVAGKNPLRT
jgi:hypothetical protein